MEAQFKSAQRIIHWLEQQPEVEKILWPAHEKDPGYPIWKRDFTGASALFAVKLKDSIPDAALDSFLDNLKLFGLGYSWAGMKVCLSEVTESEAKDDSTAFERCFGCLIGLEDSEDLIKDLQRGFEALRKETP